MATNKLFGNRISSACRHCRQALKYIKKDDTCLCVKKGVVSGGFRCRSYVYDPLKREPLRLALQKDYREDEFSL